MLFLGLRQTGLNELGVGRLAGKWRVTQAPKKGVRRHQLVAQLPNTVPVAGPFEVGGLVHHARPHRVQVNVDHASQKIALTLNEVAAVTALPQGAGALMAQVEVAHISAAHRLHHLRQALIGFGGEQQMEVVVHDHVGMDGHLESLRMLLPQGQETLTVGVITHDGLAVIAALDDVVRVSGNGEAGLAGHGQKWSVCAPV